MLKTMENAERDAALRVADLMAAAARTAPKGSGKDKVVTVILSGEEKDTLAQKMHEAAAEYQEDFIERDARNVENSHCVVLIGVTAEPFGLNNCSMCGFKNCAEMKKAGANCAFTLRIWGSLSALLFCSRRPPHRQPGHVLCRQRRSAHGLLSAGCAGMLRIPLYTGAKSIYFDRAPGSVLL